MRWTNGFTFFHPGASPFARLQVPGNPNVDVLLAYLPSELQERGARIEIRTYPSGQWAGDTRLFVWEDKDTTIAVTETLPSVARAKERAEVVVTEMIERLHLREGRAGYR